MAIRGLPVPPSLGAAGAAGGGSLGTLGLVLNLLGGAGVVGGLLGGGDDGLSGSDLERNIRRRPLGGGRLSDELTLQALDALLSAGTRLLSSNGRAGAARADSRRDQDPTYVRRRGPGLS